LSFLKIIEWLVVIELRKFIVEACYLKRGSCWILSRLPKNNQVEVMGSTSSPRCMFERFKWEEELFLLCVTIKKRTHKKGRRMPPLIILIHGIIEKGIKYENHLLGFRVSYFFMGRGGRGKRL
jgi:hypothetical protein